MIPSSLPELESCLSVVPSLPTNLKMHTVLHSFQNNRFHVILLVFEQNVTFQFALLNATPSIKFIKRKVERDVLIWTRAENFFRNSERKGSSGLNWTRTVLFYIIKIKKERNWTHPKSSGKKIVGLVSIAHCTQLLFSLRFLTGLVSF